jgi:hypothetical protein
VLRGISDGVGGVTFFRCTDLLSRFEEEEDEDEEDEEEEDED